jgi:hypothetical protein
VSFDKDKQQDALSHGEPSHQTPIELEKRVTATFEGSELPKYTPQINVDYDMSDRSSAFAE